MSSIGSIGRLAMPAALLVLLVLLGCSERSGQAPAAGQRSGPSFESTLIEQATAKLATYVSCYNTIDAEAESSMESYERWVRNMASGPTGRERPSPGLSEIVSQKKLEECGASFAGAATRPPAFTTLDPAAARYAQAFGQLAKAVGDAAPYYKREDWKDDQFARGKALHPALARSFDDYRAAVAPFYRSMAEETDRIEGVRLTQIEKTQGRTLPYWQMAVMLEAKRMLDVFKEPQPAVDLAGVRLEAYERTVDEAEAYAKTLGNRKPATWSLFAGANEDLRIAAKARLRHLRDKKSFTREELASIRLHGSSSYGAPAASAEHLIYRYNELVSKSNHLR